MKRKVIALGIFLLLFQAMAVTALDREKNYKGDKDYLLKEGDRLLIDDLKLRVRHADHILKEAVLEFSVHGSRLERVALRRGESFNFQDKLSLTVLDVYRKSNDHRRETYVRLALQTRSSGKISELQLEKSFGRKPYALIQNTGLTTETFFIKATSEKNYLSIIPEKQLVTVSPFEGKRVSLMISPKGNHRPDVVTLNLYQDGKKIDSLSKEFRKV